MRQLWISVRNMAILKYIKKHVDQFYYKAANTSYYYFSTGRFIRGIVVEITLLLASAMITLLRLDREVLIFLVSSNRWPVDPESLSLSDPAKSTRLRLPVQFSPVLAFTPWIFNMNTECERELLSLQLVVATARAFFALLNNWSMLCPFVTFSVCTKGKNTF